MASARLHCPALRSKVGGIEDRSSSGTNTATIALINGYTGATLPSPDTIELTTRRLKLVLALAAALIVAGCGGANVRLHDPTIPEPLISQLPLKVAARYPDVFDDFKHEETVIGKENWQIDLGQSNRLLFTQLFSSMFTEFSVVDDDRRPEDLDIDALIEPSIDAFEFSVPSQSQTEEFAVWIRYRIKIYDGNGTQIANWPIAAYGKSLSTLFGGDEALQRAAVLAMRDAAALIILQMDKATGISKLSQASRQAANASLPTTATEQPPDEPR